MLFWMNVGATFKDVGYKVLEILKDIGYAILCFFIGAFRLARNILYGILTIAYRIGMIAFLVSFYYIYKCYCEYKSGVGFSDMVNLPYALYLFLIPLGIAVLREIVRPKY